MEATRGRRRMSMANFVERPIDTSDRSRHTVISIPIDTTVEVLVADDTDQASELSIQCLDLNRAFSLGLEVTKMQRAAYTLGIILNVFTGDREAIRRAVASVGIGLNFIHLPSQANAHFIDWPRVIPSTRLAMVHFGIAILMLYKNVTDANYERYVAQRAQALCAMTSYNAEPGEGLNIFRSVNDADYYRKTFGNNHQVKVTVLKAILAQVGTDSIIGRVCDYLSRIISWHEMSAVLFINHTLLVPKSPVLNQPIVANEVLALSRAMKKIMAKTYPQYFRILAPTEEHRLVERNNFPLLIQVARELLRSSTSSAQNFMGIQNIPTNAVVADLVSLHNRHFLTTRPSNIETQVKFLTDQTEEDDLETQDNIAAEPHPEPNGDVRRDGRLRA